MTNEVSVAECRVLHVVAGALIFEGSVLIGQRKPGGSAGMKWEFPGGKVETWETPEAALIREFDEELNAQVQVGAPLGQSEIERGAGMLRLDLFRLELLNDRRTLQNRAHLALQWAGADGLADFEWAPADLPFLNVVESLLRLCLNQRPRS
jgi:8-oxo-dGTP diphosphatase